ncbi:thiol reductant ABC exporter subunit CydD [Paenalcaligenes niemegkensis]|uniref:thiol reductant ABC exporter subunit CydD n=1 Tax=Paenalcaligenes niemegkensis TaxID=2895469 RepID=UPI001EE8FCA8|nr:thiol reductant ABC exporter subunit CydD [Paenalcaligenes niemegkensis]MCQ9615555.1 thiol reductant ABC exporter subunit CydD [Paenalcaligenes niemegkensis]
MSSRVCLLRQQTLVRLGEAWLRQTWREAPLRAAWALLAPLLAGLLFIPQAWYLAQTLQLAIVSKASLDVLLNSILLIAAILVLRALVVWSGERCASSVAETVKHRLRSSLLHELLHRGPAWTKRYPSGELATAVMDHVEALDGYLQRYMAAALAAVFLPLLLSLAVFGVDWVVALLLLVTAPLIPLFMALVGWGAEAANQKHQRALLRLSGVFGDRIKGLFTLTLFGQAGAEVASVRRASVELGQTTMKVLRIAFLSSAVLELFAALGVAGVAVYMGLSYLGMLGAGFSGFTLQHGLFCLFIAPEVYQPLRQLAASYHDRAQAKAAVQGLEQLFVTLPVVADSHTTQPSVSSVMPLNQQVSVEAPCGLDFSRSGLMPTVLKADDLSLSTPGGFSTLLESTSLTLRRGDSVAIVGASGSGKTTLLESLVGLRPRTSGEITLYTSGKPTPSVQSLHLPGVCLIGPSPFLALGTVADSLRLAAPSATDEQLWWALERVQMADLLRSTPDGLQSLIGNRGFGFSGGQIHRIALARLFLSNASLVLLDEPTAHLDWQTRDQVLDAILAFCDNRALVIATHDPVVAGKMTSRWHLEGAVLHGVGP